MLRNNNLPKDSLFCTFLHGRIGAVSSILDKGIAYLPAQQPCRADAVSAPPGKLPTPCTHMLEACKFVVPKKFLLAPSVP